MEFVMLVMQKTYKGFKGVYEIRDNLGSIKYTISRKSVFKSVFYLRDHRKNELLEIKQKNWYKSDHLVFRQGGLIAHVKNTKSYPKQIYAAFCEDCIYEAVSFKTFKYDVSILKSDEEVGKISRKYEGFSQLYGIAIREDEDVEAIIALLFIMRIIQESQ